MGSIPSPQPTLYFDGACPVCAREIALYRASPGADALAWVDVSACGAEALGPGLTRDVALRRLHFRGVDGQLLSGAAAFTALWRQLPRWQWLGRLFSGPFAETALDAGYSVFLHLRRLWRRAA